MKTKRMLGILLAITFIVSSCFMPVRLFADGGSASVFTNFITRSGDKLMDGSNEFRFISANVPTLLMVEDVYWHIPDPWEQEDAIKTVKQMGGNVIRTYVLSVKKATDTYEVRHVTGPNQFNEAAFAALDHALALANQYGVRLIIPFVDEYIWQGGVADYAAFRGKSKSAFYTDAQIKQDFKDTISYVLNRVNTVTGVAYKNDPAILAWETGNELVPPNQAWTHEMAAYIKSIDSNHLVVDGKYGIDTASLTDDAVDIVSNHYYPSHYSDYTAQCATDRANSEGQKPFIIGEFGFVKPSDVQNLLNQVIENGTAGAFIWSLRFHNKDGGFYPHTEGIEGGDRYCALRWPGFTSGNSYYEKDTLALLRNKAYEIQGIPVPAAEAPETPVMLPIDSVSAITWRGSTGATGYDVYRKTETGDWGKIASDFAFTLSDPQYFNDTTAVTGESYYYAVVAKNGTLESAKSDPVGPVLAKHAIVDNINGGAYYVEWGKFYARSTGLQYDGSSIDKYHGDYFRLKQKTTAPQQYVSYALPVPANGHTIVPGAFSIETYFDSGYGSDFIIQTSADDQTYANLTTVKSEDAGAEGEKVKVTYTGTLPVDTKYVSILFPADASAELGKVTLEYGTDGSGLTFPGPKEKVLVSDGKLIDDMVDDSVIFDHEGTLDFQAGDSDGYYHGDVDRVGKKNDAELTSVVYKAAADMNYLKLATYTRQDNGTYQVPKFKIYTSTDGTNFNEGSDYAFDRKYGDPGWWYMDTYTIYALPSDTRYVKIEYPDLSGGHSWQLLIGRVEIGVGSAVLEPPAANNSDVIDNFDNYNGSNTALRQKCATNIWGSAGSIALDTGHKNGGSYGLAYTANLDTKGPNNGTGFYGYDMSLDNKDWSGKSGIQLWIDPNGQTMPLEFQFQETSSNEQWKCTVSVAASQEAGFVQVPFSSFTRNDGVWNKNTGDPKYNGILDLDDIYTFGIYTNGSGSRTVYIDSIGLYQDNSIDTFEGYGGDNAKLQTAYTKNKDGDTAVATLDSSDKNAGSYGMKYDYTIGSKGFCGLEKNMNHADWSGSNGIQLWLKPDGSNRNLSVQFKEASGDYWKAQLTLSGSEGGIVQIPYSSFFRPDWQDGSGTIDLNDIIEFGLYIDGSAGSGSIYFDSLTPAKLTGIDNFDYYNGSNLNLQKSYWTVNGDINACPVTISLDGTNKNDGISALKYDYDTTTKNWGGITKVLPDVDWSARNAISLWVKGDGSSRVMTVQFKESSEEYWEASFDLTGSSPQVVTIPLSSFARPGWCGTGNNVIDLNDITQLSLNIDKGPSGPGTGTLYIDSIQLTDIPDIDTFDNYDGAELTGKHVYVPNSGGNTVTMTPDSVNKDSGKYGVHYQYTVDNTKDFAGATKNLNGMNWSGTDGIQFWYKPDGTNNKLTIQFKEPNHEAWETYVTLSGTQAQTIYLPFSDFHYPPWYSGGTGANGEIDLDAIAEFSIYVNLVDGGTTGTHDLYFDSIKVVKGPENNDNTIDLFEGYGNDSELNAAWTNTNNSSAAQVTASLSSDHKNQGSQGMMYDVTYSSGNTFSELSKTLNNADWTGRTGIEFWVDTLGQDGPLELYITEASGERWKVDNWMTGANYPGIRRLPFSSFYWVSGGTEAHQLDLEDIVKIDLDTWGNAGGSRLYYIDSMQVYGDTLAPSVPANVTVTTGSALNMDISWDASTDNVGVAGYNIYRDGDKIGTTDQTNYTDAAPSPLTDYTYTVEAFDAQGNVSVQSDPVTAKSGDAEAIPEDPESKGTIDLFSNYSSNDDLRAVWTSNPDAAPVTASLSSAYRDKGNYGMEYNVTYGSATYSELSRALDHADWTGTTGIEYWVDTLKADGPLEFYITEASGERWKADNWMTGADYPGFKRIPFSSFYKVWGTGNDQLDLNDIVRIDLDTWGNAGNSRLYYIDSMQVYGDTQAPSVPANVTGTAGSGLTINLSWDASNDNMAVTGYNVYRDGVKVGTADQTNYTDTVPEYATDYDYTVEAFDAQGNTSDKCAPVTVTSAAAPNNNPPDDSTPSNNTPPPQPQPVISDTGSATINPQAGGTVGLGTEAKVEIPAGALEGTGTKNVTVQTKDETEAPSGFKVLGKVYEFSVNNAESYHFSQPVTLTFEFTPSQLGNGEVPAVFYYNKLLGRWVLVGGIVQGNKIKVDVDHFTEFAVFSIKRHAFPDVPVSHAAYSAITTLDQLGCISGYTNGNFGPGDLIKRAEIATIMTRAFQLPAPTVVKPDFTDVKPTDWFFNFVESAYIKGLIKGSAGLFDPRGYITREQLIAILINASGKKLDNSASKTSFADDNSISAWARSAVAEAQKEGLITYDTFGNNLNPQAKVMRFEACQMIANFIDKQR